MKPWLTVATLALGLMVSTAVSAREFDIMAGSPEALIALQLPTKALNGGTLAASVVVIFAQDQALYGAQLAYL